MPKTIPEALHDRWFTGNLVGEARPRITAEVRKGHFTRGYDDDGHWQATWLPTSDWLTLGNVASFELQQSFDNNGIAVGTLEVENTELVEHAGVLGEYHKIERGWYSPLRSYKPPEFPGPLRKSPNIWSRILGIVAEIRIYQGYGDSVTVTFTGLFDTTSITPLPDKIHLSARDFGQILADQDLFGWNIDPKLRDPVTFWDRARNRKLLTSGDSVKVGEGERHQKKWVLIDDVADMVRVACRWSGFPKESLRIHDTGAPLKLPVSFTYTEHHMDIIQKACELTGFTFFIGTPSLDHPMGRPTFKAPHSHYLDVPTLSTTLVNDWQLLEGLNWQTTDEPKVAIYRVRGKNTPRDRGGVGLGHIRTPALLSVYRPPWHTAAGGAGGSDRDARILRHAIKTEPLYDSQKEVDTAAVMWALNSALAATTATVEIPCLPSIQIDDVLGVHDAMAGFNSRCWISGRTETFTGGREASWVQSLNVSSLDDPDVVGVVEDLHRVLTGLPTRGLK